MSNKTVYSSLLASIQSTVNSTEEVPFNEELIGSVSAQVEPIASFFSINPQEAILLAFMLNASIKDMVVSKDSLITHFGKDITAIADIDQTIVSLAEKRLVIIKGSSRRSRFSYKTVMANPRTVLAMTEGDISALYMKKGENFNDVLMDVNDLMIQRIYDNITTEMLSMEITSLLNMNDHLEEIKWLLSQKELKKDDLLVFLNICVEVNSGEEDVDMDKILKEVFDTNSARMLYKQNMRNEKCFLLTNNYIQLSGELFGMGYLVALTDHSMVKLFSYTQGVTQKSFHPKMGQFISCESIKEEKLFYNAKEFQQINTLSRALDHEQYTVISNRMRENNMRPGFTVLMFGHPGTGKTSSVKSLARMTGRHIFMVDIPKINSKWVGESEKNISKVFEEYRTAKKQFDKVPILLFNEADAIFGKRGQVQNSVDKMRNSIQNILLQELEDFEGIFIATTNLADQLDSAFDRRLLYKLEFKKPEDEVSFNILQHAFPTYETSMLMSVNKDYPLTGGQIANIKKKLLVSEMLDPECDRNKELTMFCEEELMLSKSNKHNPIGFRMS